MDDIVINDLDQSGDMYLIEQRDKFFTQHGGLCTRFSFDEMSVMSLDTFLTKEVKNLAKMRHNTMEVYQLKDVVNNHASLIFGDEVVKYNLTNIEQVPMDIMAKELVISDDETLMPELHYPLVQLKTLKNGDRNITVMIPPTKRSLFFKFPNVKAMTLGLTLPEMWLTVKVNQADSIKDIKVAVVKDRCRRTLDTELYVLPLPHMYHNGHICLGSATVVNAPLSNGEKRTNGELVELAIAMLFGSEWTNHLITSHSYDNVLGSLYSTMPKVEEIEEAIGSLSSNRSMAQCLRCIRVLMHPTGYMKLNYQHLNVTTKAFLDD